MAYRILRAHRVDPLWPLVEEHFSKIVKWMSDPRDSGEYHCFLAVDAQDAFLGGAVIDLGEIGYGPVADRPAAYLEQIFVCKPARRRGIGSALLRTALDLAWAAGAEYARWTVDFHNTAALALFDALGCAFLPVEDPEALEPEKTYSVLAMNPQRARLAEREAEMAAYAWS